MGKASEVALQMKCFIFKVVLIFQIEFQIERGKVWEVEKSLEVDSREEHKRSYLDFTK